MDRQQGLIAPPHAGASGFTGVTGDTGQAGVTGARTLLPLVSMSPGLILKSVHDHKAMGDKVSLRHRLQALVASPA